MHVKFEGPSLPKDISIENRRAQGVSTVKLKYTMLSIAFKDRRSPPTLPYYLNKKGNTIYGWTLIQICHLLCLFDPVSYT